MPVRKTRLLLLTEALLESADRHSQAIPAIRGKNPVAIMGRASAHALVVTSCCLLAWGIASLAMVLRLRAVK